VNITKQEQAEEPPHQAATDKAPLNRVRTTIEVILQAADIRINGARPWDLQIHNEQFFPRVLAGGSLGFGESYMDGWWDCDAMDEMFYRAIRNRLVEKVRLSPGTLLTMCLSYALNLQTKRRAREVGRKHYDLGNDFFQAMLDPAMQYSCGYFKDTTELNIAQEKKMDLICRKLGLKPGMRLLDIGCGWGGLARFAATHYGCEVVGITISQQQFEFARSTCKDLPIEIRLQDYRDLSETFDRAVSVGMVEHVGYKNFQAYMQTVARCLVEEGLFLCHTIGDTVSKKHCDRWIGRYIFPNSMLPSVSQISRAAEKFFVLEDVHNFGAYYDKTLLAWEKNFQAHWARFEERYGERFHRMWRFYLLSCAAAFRARSIELYQFVFSKHGILGGYTRPE